MAAADPISLRSRRRRRSWRRCETSSRRSEASLRDRRPSRSWSHDSNLVVTSTRASAVASSAWRDGWRHTGRMRRGSRTNVQGRRRRIGSSVQALRVTVERLSGETSIAWAWSISEAISARGQNRLDLPTSQILEATFAWSSLSCCYSLT